jgi:hypothetical protein
MEEEEEAARKENMRKEKFGIKKVKRDSSKYNQQKQQQ